ncbi:MAG: hypothetical protein WCP21_21165 [Armatimonadota bacterium]
MSRRLLICLLLLLVTLRCPAQLATSVRADLPLHTWRFQPGHLGVEPTAAGWVPVRLPYTWTETWTRPSAAAASSWATQDLHDTNSAWYEADVTVPPEWRGGASFWTCAACSAMRSSRWRASALAN